MTDTPRVEADGVFLPFRPRARLLQLLGDQLIGSHRLAVFELVKNAYDADATQVTITLNDIDRPDATIVVEDDGDGMTLDTIRDIWLVPGHDHREAQRKAGRRTKLMRLPLGEKGVGRFAVHKLGDRISLVTRAAGQPECVVSIDWAALISEEMLSDAKVRVTTRPAVLFKGKRTGTRLEISRLRQTEWSRGEVRRLLRQITSISSPFRERSDVFRADLSVPQHPEWVAGTPDVEMLLQRAPWKFTFSFVDGQLTWVYEFRGVTGMKLSSRHAGAERQPLLLPPQRDTDEFGTSQGTRSARPRPLAATAATALGIGPVSGVFYVFDRDRVVLSRLGDSQLIQNYLDENGGVRVYRDGIRVYNYGEPGDDWLGLDLRRVNTPTRNLSRNIVVGAIDLVLESSAGLSEKTNREGFVENDAYTRFKKIILGAIALLEVERKIDKDNIRKLTTGGRDVEVEKIKRPLEALRFAARANNVGAALEPLIDKVERDYDEMRDTMLRAGLSGMGLAIVFHEIEQGVRVLHDAIQAGVSADAIQVQARELVRILDSFTDLLRKGDRREFSLKTVIRRARDVNTVRFRNHRVRLHAPDLEEGTSDVTATFAFGLVLGALNNLLDNAFYWLRVRWPDDAESITPRAIHIGLNLDFPGGPAIIVADTGPGFNDDPEQLTKPFFSRRPEGMGIGLYYANLVMELNGGQIAFPDAEEAGIPEGFDGAIIALVFPTARRA